MKYMVDNNVNGLAKKLKLNEIDCETSTKLIRGDEDSSLSISDPKIFRFLLDAKHPITLITADHDLADYCNEFQIPVMLVDKPESPADFDKLAIELSNKLKSE